MRNALTIDVEDYFQVTAFEPVVQYADWEGCESRVERNTHALLEGLEAHETQATFFILGWVAERYPQLVRAIEAAGHEVAAHGYAHQRIYTQTPARFREETQRVKACLEDIIGRPILGYRAASYSITTASLWALDILQETGFVYDSSIFPVRHDFYGIPDHPRFCHVLNGEGHAGLVEFPMSTVRLGNFNLPIAGGGYFRLYPYALSRWGIRHLNRAEQQPAVVYLHPWEVDPQQPRLPARGLSKFRHYVNLDKTLPRLQRLLRDFDFAPMATVLRDHGFLHGVHGGRGL